LAFIQLKEENMSMTKFRNLALGTMMAIGVVAGFTAPASAGASIGIGIGGPGPGPYWHRHWCAYHPYRCGGGPGYVDGYYRPGSGFWWHGGWWGHRHFNHGHWRYWR